MTAVVGMDHIKQALLLGACDTGLGGICIAGKRGTCKVIGSSCHRLCLLVEGAICAVPTLGRMCAATKLINWQTLDCNER